MAYNTFTAMIFGDTWTVATLQAAWPASPENCDRWAYVTDRPGGAGFMMCNGVAWITPGFKRIEFYTGVTDASGNITFTHSPAFGALPHSNPVTKPPADATTRVRITAESISAVTVKTERNNSLSVLGLDVLGLGTGNVAGVNVGVLCVGN